MSAARAAIVFHRGPYNTAAQNVLLGALEEAPEARGLEFVLVTGRARLAEALRAARDRDQRVLALWSFYSPEAARAASDLEWVRESVPGVRALHVAGGAHASAEPRATLQGGFDLVAQGEGEHTVRALAAALARGEEPGPIPGLGRLRDGELHGKGRGLPAELDEFPPFAPAHGRFNALEITRGCVFACSFCQTPFLFKARFRHRSVANVTRWTDLMRRAGCRYVRFLSPTAFSYGASDEGVDLGALEQLLAGVRASLGPAAKIYFGTFPSEVRPEHVTPATLALVRRYASNTELVIGGQSGSDRVLGETHRGHGTEDVRRAVRIALESGFLPNVDFLFGLPSERAEDRAASLAFAAELADLGARIHAHSFMPLPGTPLADTRAGALGEHEMRALERLANRGTLYGQWRSQQAIARRLEAARAGAVPPV